MMYSATNTIHHFFSNLLTTAVTTININKLLITWSSLRFFDRPPLCAIDSLKLLVGVSVASSDGAAVSLR